MWIYHLLSCFLTVRCTEFYTEEYEAKSAFLCSSRTENLVDSSDRYIPAHSYSRLLKCFCNSRDFLNAGTLGTGSFGKVFRGLHLPSSTIVALKTISMNKQSLKRDRLKRYDVASVTRNEECIHARLDHPAIPKFYCSYVNMDGDVVLVLEMIKGEELFDKVAPNSVSTDSSSSSEAQSGESERCFRTEHHFIDFDDANGLKDSKRGFHSVYLDSENSRSTSKTTVSSTSPSSSFESCSLTSTSTSRTGSSSEGLYPRRSYNWDELRLWTAQLVHVVAYLHSMDVVVVDLKLENLMIDQYGNLRMIDFGLSHWWDGAEKLDCEVVGTPRYMAPETLANLGKHALPSADWYSVGIVFYEMLYHHGPFSGQVSDTDSVNEYIEQWKRTTCHKPVKCYKASKYPDLEDLVVQLTRINPNDRLGYSFLLNSRACNNFPLHEDPDLYGQAEDETGELTVIFAHPWLSDITPAMIKDSYRH